MTVDELGRFEQKKWQDIDQSMINNWIKPMKSCCLALIASGEARNQFLTDS
jgi:hypothetical protein